QGVAVRERIFTELGNGAVDLDGVLRGLDRIGYSGWLMVEQDSSPLHPSEAAAIGRRVLEYARGGAGRAVARARPVVAARGGGRGGGGVMRIAQLGAERIGAMHGPILASLLEPGAL